jgi:hypothetical protein
MARVAHGGSPASASHAATWETFTEEFHGRVEACRTELTDELAVIAALVRMGAIEPAAHALGDQRRAVHALTADLDDLIASAISADAADRALAMRVRAAQEVRHAPAARLRLAGAIAAALLGLGAAIPVLRQQPVAQFEGLRPVGGTQTEDEQQREAMTLVHDARVRLAAIAPTTANADEVTAEARALHDQILALPDEALADKQLRREIHYLLLEQSEALRGLAGDPEAASLLAEVRALSASLGLPLDVVPLPPLPVDAAPLPEQPPELPPVPPPPPPPRPAPPPPSEPVKRLADQPGQGQQDDRTLDLERPRGMDRLRRDERPNEPPRLDLKG